MYDKSLYAPHCPPYTASLHKKLNELRVTSRLRPCFCVLRPFATHTTPLVIAPLLLQSCQSSTCVPHPTGPRPSQHHAHNAAGKGSATQRPSHVCKRIILRSWFRHLFLLKSATSAQPITRLLRSISTTVAFITARLPSQEHSPWRFLLLSRDIPVSDRLR